MDTLNRFLQKHKKKLYLVMSICIIFILILYSYGYRWPCDRHPDWPRFFIIEDASIQQIYDIKGGIRMEFFRNEYDKKGFLDSLGFDTKQFDLPDSLKRFYTYKPNFSKADSDAIVSNEFKLGNNWKLNMSSNGDNLAGSNSNEYHTRFDHYIFQYFEVKMGNHSGYFKLRYNDFFGSYYEGLYQCNNVKKDTDTLYFVYSEDLYRAYVLNPEKK